MRLASVVVTRSVTWCGLPKAGSCSRLRCSATAAYSGDSRRSLRTVRDDLMHYAGAAISRATPVGAGPGRPALVASRCTSREARATPLLLSHLAAPSAGSVLAGEYLAGNALPGSQGAFRQGRPLACGGVCREVDAAGRGGWEVGVAGRCGERVRGV